MPVVVVPITIVVNAPIANYSTNITASVSGGNITIDWPATHLLWILQTQTNQLTVGLSTNWVPVAGSTATNSMTFPIGSGNPFVFYRLTAP